MNYEELSYRELDALVAEKVLRVDEEAAKQIATTWWPSTDVSDAFDVVEAMRERGRWFEIETEPQGWHVVIGVEPGCTGEEASHESLPRAICIAALRALDA